VFDCSTLLLRFRRKWEDIDKASNPEFADQIGVSRTCLLNKSAEFSKTICSMFDFVFFDKLLHYFNPVGAVLNQLRKHPARSPVK